MSTWEERMAAKAQARLAVERARERLEYDIRVAEEHLQSLKAALADFTAPPCPDCYEWWPRAYFGPQWGHVRAAVVPGPAPEDFTQRWGPTPNRDWCYHSCHGGQPFYTERPAMASSEARA